MEHDPKKLSDKEETKLPDVLQELDSQFDPSDDAQANWTGQDENEVHVLITYGNEDGDSDEEVSIQRDDLCSDMSAKDIAVEIY